MTGAIEAHGWGWRHAGRRAWALRGLDLRDRAPGSGSCCSAPRAPASRRCSRRWPASSTRRAAARRRASCSSTGEARAPRAIGSGLVFQDPESELVMGRAGDDVAFGLENRCVPAGEIWSRVDAALAAVGFPYGRGSPDARAVRRRAAAAGARRHPGPVAVAAAARRADREPGSRRRGARARRRCAACSTASGATMLMVEHRVDAALPTGRPRRGARGGRRGASPMARRARSSRATATSWRPRGLGAGRPRPAPPARRRPAARDTLARRAGRRSRYPGAERPAPAADRRSSPLLRGAGDHRAERKRQVDARPAAGRPAAANRRAPWSPARRSRRGHGHEPIWRWAARRPGDAPSAPSSRTRSTSSSTGSVRDGAGARARSRQAIAPTRGARRAEELLERLHLAALAEANPFTLSGGEKRRLSVATALAAAPSVLVLDEPTFGQDRRTSMEMLELLAALRDEGRAVCVVTHDLPFADAPRGPHASTLETPPCEPPRAPSGPATRRAAGAGESAGQAGRGDRVMAVLLRVAGRRHRR